MRLPVAKHFFHPNSLSELTNEAAQRSLILFEGLIELVIERCFNLIWSAPPSVQEFISYGRRALDSAIAPEKYFQIQSAANLKVRAWLVEGGALPNQTEAALAIDALLGQLSLARDLGNVIR